MGVGTRRGGVSAHSQRRGSHSRSPLSDSRPCRRESKARHLAGSFREGPRWHLHITATALRAALHFTRAIREVVNTISCSFVSSPEQPAAPLADDASRWAVPAGPRLSPRKQHALRQNAETTVQSDASS